MRLQQVKKFILNKLTRELPKQLTYHSIHHVLDVCSAAENIGNLERVSKTDLKLLITAALFHDSGFINGSKDHEEESCRIAQEYLPGYGYTAAEIDKINGMIMATKIPQSPTNLLEQIIADADLDYLGRDDFFPISDNLFTELNNAGILDDENKWNKIQVSFFEGHHYFTASALKLRKEKKAEHLEQIKLKIK